MIYITKKKYENMGLYTIKILMGKKITIQFRNRIKKAKNPHTF